jgi:hypothetical protein
MAMVAPPAEAWNSSAPGEATASITVKTVPARIADSRSDASRLASALGGDDRITRSEKLRKVVSYDGTCSRRPEVPPFSLPKPP